MQLRRIMANNPSPMTGTGTNTYLIGQGIVTVIDPGPDDPAHLRAILGALDDGERIGAVLVTHSHRDHSGLAHRLADEARAEIMAYGPAGSGRSPVMRRLAEAGLTGGGEGFDTDFRPDRRLVDGETLHIGDTTIEVLHTPGHTGCHLSFAVQDRLFSGDHVMGWATSLVSPPDGDMGAYMASLQRLSQHDWQSLMPGHGEAVTDPGQRLSDLIAHRRTRTAQILAALQLSAATPAELTARIYTDIPAALIPAAQRNVLAHLIDLTETGMLRAKPAPASDAVFSLI